MGRRDNNNNVSKRDRSISPRGNPRRFGRRHLDDDEDEDDAEDDHGNQASSAHGDEN